MNTISLSSLIFLCLVTVSCGEESRKAERSLLVQETHLNTTYAGIIRNPVVHQHNKIVVCYVATWSTYREDSGSYKLSHIDPQQCTHLIYSFAGLNNVTFEIQVMDPWLDISDSEQGGGRDWYTQFNELKENYPHLRVLLAVGGWNEGSQKYSKMASSAANRLKFIESAMKILRTYDFDGLDMDWEFPGNRGGTPEDKYYFTVLMKELRRKLDKYGLMLTAAFSASPKIAKEGYELRELAGVLDHFHIMAYDLHGAWDEKASHNAPLLGPRDDDSVSRDVEYFLANGVPPFKIVLGVPFYGRTFLLTNSSMYSSGLGDASEKKGFQGPYTKEQGFLGYNEICEEFLSNRGDWVTYWDHSSEVPFMRNGAKWVSFDNPDSIKLKAEYILEKGLRGAMIWSIDTDDFLGKCGVPNPLLKTINNVFASDEEMNEIPTTMDTGKSSIFSISRPLIVGSLLVITASSLISGIR